MTLTRSLLLSALLLTGCATPSQESSTPTAEQTPPGVPTPSSEFPNVLGPARAADSGAVCLIALTAPSGSPLKSQKINFMFNRPGGVSAEREFTVNTGTSKTLGQLQGLLGSALRRAATSPAGTELVKVGDIRFGGEFRLTAQEDGQVSISYLPEGEQPPTLSAGEAAAFATLLGK